MALTGTESILATTICTTLGIIGNPDLSEDEINAAKANWEKIAKDIFNHFVLYADVMPVNRLTAVPPVPLTSGAPGAPVTGLGSIL